MLPTDKQFQDGAVTEDISPGLSVGLSVPDVANYETQMETVAHICFLHLD